MTRNCCEDYHYKHDIRDGSQRVKTYAVLVHPPFVGPVIMFRAGCLWTHCSSRQLEEELDCVLINGLSEAMKSKVIMG